MPTIGTSDVVVEDAVMVDPPVGEDASDALGEAVIALVRAWKAAGRRTPDMPQSAMSVLEISRLLGEGEHRLSALAELRGVDQSVVSRQIVELERRGLVCRRRDPTDGRASLVRLTAAGLDVLAQVRTLRARWLRGALARCDVADVSTAARLIDALTAELLANADELGQLAAPP